MWKAYGKRPKGRDGLNGPRSQPPHSPSQTRKQLANGLHVTMQNMRTSGSVLGTRTKRHGAPGLTRSKDFSECTSLSLPEVRGPHVTQWSNRVTRPHTSRPCDVDVFISLVVGFDSRSTSSARSRATTRRPSSSFGPGCRVQWCCQGPRAQREMELGRISCKHDVVTWFEDIWQSHEHVKFHRACGRK